MDLWELIRTNRIFRWFAAVVLAFTAVVALTVIVYSPNGLRIPTFNDLFPPPSAPLTDEERVAALRALEASASSSVRLSEEERLATLQALEESASTSPKLTDEQRLRALQQFEMAR